MKQKSSSLSSYSGLCFYPFYYWGTTYWSVFWAPCSLEQDHSGALPFPFTWFSVKPIKARLLSSNFSQGQIYFPYQLGGRGLLYWEFVGASDWNHSCGTAFPSASLLMQRNIFLLTNRHMCCPVLVSIEFNIQYCIFFVGHEAVTFILRTAALIVSLICWPMNNAAEVYFGGKGGICFFKTTVCYPPSFLPGWKIERLPSVCPNTTFPFFFGCHLNRQISDKKLWASLCTVTPLSGPEIVQIYSGPLWDINATTSPAFQHQLRDAGIPEI